MQVYSAAVNSAAEHQIDEAKRPTPAVASRAEIEILRVGWTKPDRRFDVWAERGIVPEND